MFFKSNSFISSLIEVAKSSKMMSKHAAAVVSGKRVLSVASNSRSDLTNENLWKHQFRQRQKPRIFITC